MEKTESYQQDNSTISAIMTFSYNGFNQLSGVEDSAGNCTYYTYNGSGLRSVKTTNETTIKYYYDGNSNIILETDADNVVTATNVRGLQLISRENEGEDPFYYLQDVHGDMTKLLDQFANVIEDYCYDPFGNEETEQLNPVSGSISTTLWQEEVEEIDNPFRYCGEYYDSETNTYYLRARYYDPAIGRFLSEDTHWNPSNMIYGDYPVRNSNYQDPLGLNTYTYVPDVTAIMQSKNLYVYCMNNPVAYFDSTGNLVYPGQVHNMVSKQIFKENTTLSRERWLKYHPFYEPLETLRGRVDLVDIKTGAIWEIKPFKAMHIASAYTQLTDYTTGDFSGKDLIKAGITPNIYNGNPDVDGYKLYGTISQNGIYVQYWYYGDGIIVYDYAESQERLEQQLSATLEVLAAAVAGALWSLGIPVPLPI